jgi:hypothetical protein
MVRGASIPNDASFDFYKPPMASLEGEDEMGEKAHGFAGGALGGVLDLANEGGDEGIGFADIIAQRPHKDSWESRSETDDMALKSRLGAFPLDKEKNGEREGYGD